MDCERSEQDSLVAKWAYLDQSYDDREAGLNKPPEPIDRTRLPLD